MLPLLAGTALAAAAVLYLALRPRASERPSAPVAAVAPESIDVGVAIPQDSVAAVPVTNARDDSARVQRALAGILALASGRGTAVVVDSAGTLVTAASLIPADQSSVDLFVDVNHRARASVVSRDASAGIAILRLHPASCRRCRPLELARGDSVLNVAGDTLLALPVVRRTAMAPQAAVVASASATTVKTAAPLAVTLLGAPLFDARSGLVAGLVTRRGGAVGVATAAMLRRSIAAVRGAATPVALNDTLYRTWPLRAVPAAELKGAEGRTPELSAFRVQHGGYDVLAMTPQLLAWRVAKSAPPAVEDNPFAIPAASPTTPADPLFEWTPWREYRDERRAVVVLMIGPDKAAYPAQPDKPLDARKGDVLSVTLTRDGTPVAPLERQRIPAVGNVELYRREKRAIPHAAVYVFHPADLVPSAGTYQLEVVDADPKRRITITLPATLLQAIARDVSPWQQ